MAVDMGWPIESMVGFVIDCVESESPEGKATEVGDGADVWASRSFEDIEGWGLLLSIEARLVKLEDVSASTMAALELGGLESSEEMLVGVGELAELVDEGSLVSVSLLTTILCHVPLWSL